MVLLQRRLQRLKDYDYCQNGAYFITLCTQNRLQLFGDIRDGELFLNDAGRMVLKKFEEMPQFYCDIIIDKFTIMPNHMHAILFIQHNRTAQGHGTAQGPFPTTMGLSDYIHRFKTLTTKLYIDGVKNYGYLPFTKGVWQKSFYDHIIRNDIEYKKIWEYIDINSLKWQEDKYFI